ncbi:hypothetical protein [Ruminococcus sp.]|uniref:hypothetical protein n=1 Tax=Ruminococcus sp. TaxID=41978 RepID=UPI0025EFC6D4|nr:hypothetical protein [Ruminococcus sp.]
MNNKKKIIDTLRSADKASVERLMAEEAKKNEIFAKAQRRANIEHNEYTDVVSGVEKYERRISMTKIASIAAAAVLLVGSIGGGAYLFRNNSEPGIPEPVLNEVTTDVTNTSTTVIGTGTGTEKTGKTTVTTSVTTVNTTVAGDAKVTEKATEKTASNGEKQSEKKFSVTKEELKERADVLTEKVFFDKFSAEYSYTIMHNEYRPKPETMVGKIYLDNTTLTASGEQNVYYDDKLIRSELYAIKDKNELYAIEYLARDMDLVNTGYIFLDAPDKKYGISSVYGFGSWYDTKVTINTIPCGTNITDILNSDDWEITGERTENGRTIVSISGHGEGYVNYDYTAEIDAATGITLSYEIHEEDGTPSTIFKATNYKFDDEAEEFKTPSDIMKEIKNGGYNKQNDDDMNIEELNW